MQQHERTFCAGCGTWRFKPEGALCFHCQPAGKEEPSVEFSTPEQPVVFGGHEVDAPGFTQDQFERAILRAFVDELVIHEAAGYDLVCHAGVNGGYRTDRMSCDCKAGQCGQCCKHRAYWIFVHDVRIPARRRQWAAAARSAVAA